MFANKRHTARFGSRLSLKSQGQKLPRNIRRALMVLFDVLPNSFEFATATQPEVCANAQLVQLNCSGAKPCFVDQWLEKAKPARRRHQRAIASCVYLLIPCNRRAGQCVPFRSRPIARQLSQPQSCASLGSLLVFQNTYCKKTGSMLSSFNFEYQLWKAEARAHAGHTSSMRSRCRYPSRDATSETFRGVCVTAC